MGEASAKQVGKDMRVEGLLERGGKVVTIGADGTVVEAADKMRDSNVGCLVVLNDRGAIAGIVTEQDIVVKAVASRRTTKALCVGEIMTRNVVACSVGASITEAQEIMADHRIRHLPLVKDGELVGMISVRDILTYQLSAAEQTLRRQAELLGELERSHPGITQVERDHAGRIVL